MHHTYTEALDSLPQWQAALQREISNLDEAIARGDWERVQKTAMEIRFIGSNPKLRAADLMAVATILSLDNFGEGEADDTDIVSYHGGNPDATYP